MGTDVATGGELAVALAAGVPAGRLVMHGNNKSAAELQVAAAAGIGRLVVDSFDELDRIDALSLPAPVPTSIRVTPGVEAHTHEYVMTGQVDSKFGFGLASGDAAAAVERARKTGGLDVVGVHAHIGSQIFLLHSFEKEIEVLARFVRDTGVPELCVGGGLGVAYVEGESAPTITEWAETVIGACRAAGVDAKVTAEPG